MATARGPFPATTVRRGCPHLEVAALVGGVRGTENGHLPAVEVTFVRDGHSEPLHGLTLEGFELHGESSYGGGAWRRHFCMEEGAVLCL